MIKQTQVSLVSRRERLRYGFGAVCIGIAALFFLLSFRGGTTQAAAAPLTPTDITIFKDSTTSIVEPADYNTAVQAVAGELVTVTVVYTVSDQIIYDASPRVLLQDGLYPTGSSPAWSAMYTGTTANDQLRQYEPLAARAGALVIFPDQGTISGTDVITMVVYAVRQQFQYIGTNEIGHNITLRIQGVLRYCADMSGCTATTATNNDLNLGSTIAIQPQVDTSYPVAPVYLDPANAITGGSQVRLTIRASGSGSRPTSHDIVYTVTLSSGLIHSDSYGEGVGLGDVSAGPDGVTYVSWNLPASLAVGNTWQAVITATLPNPLVVGSQFTYSGMAAYDTFAGDVDDEGHYTRAGGVQTLTPVSVLLTKTSLPAGGAVTMGDTVSYTVVIRQAADTILNAPQLVDTQPLGFHYISDTFTLEGTTCTTFTTEGGGTGNVYQNLRCVMDDFPLSAQSRFITATYAVLNTGLNYAGDPVYATAADMRASRNSVGGSTGAVLWWTPPAGSTYNSSARANPAALGVIQPFMGDQFSTLRTDAGNREIGQSVNLAIRFHNLGASVSGIAIPAHELEVCDILPVGLVFSQDNGCFISGTSTVCPFDYTTPSIGDEGVVCWQVPELARTTTFYEFRYQASINAAAFPGTHTNEAYVTTYSSQPGSVEGERVYSEFPEVLPTANCGATCMTILGLEGNKMPWDTRVAPGTLLTYTLLFTDTSSAHDYTGLAVTDTYDPLLSFVGATPMPTSHNAGTRTLVWDLDAVPAGGNREITLTMQVASEIEAQYALTNTVTWDSDQTTPHTLSTVTEIEVANLHVGISGSELTHAGGSVVLTVVYSNTGSSATAPVTLTLDYGPYLTYVSASPLAPVPGTQNRVFVDTVSNDGVNQILTINLTTNAPLPYTLDEIISMVTLTSAGAPAQVDAWTMTLQRPIFEFEKTGPDSAPTGVGSSLIYTFHIQNTGDYTATAIVITDTWDTSTSFFAGASGAWVEEAGQGYAYYMIPSLAPGAIASVDALVVEISTIQDRYTNLAELGSAQTSVQETSEQTWAPSIELAKTASPDPAFPGRVLTYTLTYSNVGGSTVSQAIITDTLPAAFSYQGHTVNDPGCAAPGWQFDITGQVATWYCTTLTANASGQLKIWGVVDTTAEETWLENMAESDGAAPVPYRPMDEPLLTLVARPWLRIDKVGAPMYPVAPGDRVTYTLSYENYGSFAAYDVIVKDQLPAQLTFIGCDPACTHNAGLVTWTIGEVPVDATGEVVVYATVNAGTGGQTAVNANYTIENTTTWQRLLPGETDQGDPVNTTILDPQLTLTKVAAPTVVQAVNETIVYTITYINDGGGLLNNVVITDVLDIHTQFSFASTGCVHDGAAAGGTVTCQLGDLENGESRQIVIRVRVLPGLSAGDVIPNQAQGKTDEAPLTSSNTTAVWYQIVTSPELAWTPLDFTPSAEEGSTTVLEDTLTVSNEGNADLLWSVEVLTPSLTTWLKIAVGGGDPGTVILPQVSAPGASTDVTVYFDPTGLTEGTYTGWLRILSNDADEGEVLVPVTFTITAAPVTDFYIFLPLVLRNY